MSFEVEDLSRIVLIIADEGVQGEDFARKALKLTPREFKVCHSEADLHGLDPDKTVVYFLWRRTHPMWALLQPRSAPRMLELAYARFGTVIIVTDWR